MHWDEPLPQVCKAASSHLALEKREEKVAGLLRLLRTLFLPCDYFEVDSDDKAALDRRRKLWPCHQQQHPPIWFLSPHRAGTCVLIGISPQLWAALVGQTQPCCISKCLLFLPGKPEPLTCKPSI